MDEEVLDIADADDCDDVMDGDVDDLPPEEEGEDEESSGADEEEENGEAKDEDDEDGEEGDAGEEEADEGIDDGGVEVDVRRTGDVRLTDQRLTKYECVRILGVRAHQLAQGAPPCVRVSVPPMSSLDIAVEELRRGRCPFVVCRRLPCGRTEKWRVSELVRSPSDVHSIVGAAVPYYKSSSPQ